MMIARVLALALMPAALLASPTLTKLQDTLDTSMDSRVTLAKTKVKVTNQFPIDTQVTLLHWRGSGESTKQKLVWDYIASSKESAPIDTQFETTRKDWDRWQAEIKFRNSDWSMLTPIFYGPIDVAFANTEYSFLLVGRTINFYGAGELEDSLFPEQGPGFPTSAKGINSYFFLYLDNQFDESVSVDVELLSAKSNDFIQKQKFKEKKGESSKTPLPFFYENNPSKDYVDLFGFKVSTSSGQSYTSTLNRCELFGAAFDATLMETVAVNSTGWAIGLPKARCSGKWNKKKTIEPEL